MSFMRERLLNKAKENDYPQFLIFLINKKKNGKAEYIFLKKLNIIQKEMETLYQFSIYKNILKHLKLFPGEFIRICL
jgi:hypothetical protein